MDTEYLFKFTVMQIIIYDDRFNTQITNTEIFAFLAVLVYQS